MKNNIEYLDKIVNILETPYFLELENYGIDEDEEMEYVLKKIYGFDIRIIGSGINDSSTGKRIYHEYSTGEWYKIEYDSDGNRTYYENSMGEIMNVALNER